MAQDNAYIRLPSNSFSRAAGAEHFVPAAADGKKLNLIFLLFCGVNVLNNFDKGFLPALLLELEVYLRLNFQQQAQLSKRFLTQAR